MNWLPVTAFSLVGFCFVSVLCWWFVFALSGFVYVTACWTMYRSITSSLLRPSISRRPCMLICKLIFCFAIERVERPGGSHEGVGRKKYPSLSAQTKLQNCVFDEQTQVVSFFCPARAFRWVYGLESCQRQPTQVFSAAESKLVILDG